MWVFKTTLYHGTHDLGLPLCSLPPTPQARGKEMTLDPTFELEQKRAEPIKYDRDLWIKTVQSIKRIQQIRKVRKERFHKQRVAANVGLCSCSSCCSQERVLL